MQPNPRILQQVLTLPEIDINEKDKQDKTALYYAILNGNVENAAILLGLPEIEKSLNDAELLICAAEKAESGNLEIIQGILAHPLLDKSLMETCLDRLELAVFPENLLETFAKHFPAKIAHASNSLYFKIPRLLNSRNTKEAQEALEAMYQKDNALEISSLLPLDINIFKFILQDNYSSYSKWLTTSQTLKELPLERQFFLCDRLEPRLFCKYLTKGIYGWVIGPMGIKALIDYLRRKAPPSLTLENSISVCHDYEDFSNQLKDLSANPNLPDGYCHYFIVAGIKKNPEEIANHVTPLFFKKEAGQWSVIITDSTTDLNNTNKYCNPLTKIILDAEETSSKNFSIKKIYINTFWRQHDATNCPVFAIRDTVNFYKKGDSFLKELSSKYQDKHTKTEWINQYDLPPDWMKSTQSIKEIEKYIGLSEKRKSLIMHTKKTQNQEETLSENLARHKKVDENHQMRNFLILQRAIKYSGIVLSYFLREMAHRPLKNPWNSLESKP